METECVHSSSSYDHQLLICLYCRKRGLVLQSQSSGFWGDMDNDEIGV